MIAEEFLLGLARRSLDASIVVLLVLAAQRLFRKQLSPHWHCTLWLLVVVRLLPLSFSSEVSLFNLFHAASEPGYLAEAESLRRQSTPSSAAGPILSDQLDPALALASSAAAAAARAGASSDAVGGPNARSMAHVFFWVWLGGALTFAGYVATSSVALSRRIARSQPLTDPNALALLSDAGARMGFARVPRVVESSAIATPALYGLFRPRLLLPQRFTASFSGAELRFVFLHELAHLRRCDLPLNWLITSLQILHWFNPIVWFAFARWRTDREIACDALAVEKAGASHNRAYGETMLRLLEAMSPTRARPSLVGILEDKRQLQRRMKMIAAFAPARRPVVGIGLLVILAAVSLTDAQVAPSPAPEPIAAPAPAVELPLPPPVPQPAGAYVLFLINGSATMLDQLDPPSASAESNATPLIERGRTYKPGVYPGTDDEKRAAPKWQLTASTVEQLLTALAPETSFRIAVFSEDNVAVIGERFDPGDQQAVGKAIGSLRNIVPRGGANLEAAFASMTELFNQHRPERIVLVTDGLPTTSRSAPAKAEVTEAERVRAFETATKRLPPRIPIHTVLVSTPPGDPGAAGLYWELANATRGRLTIPAKPGTEPRTHLAFVVDTSGSMRDPNTGAPWPVIIDTIGAILDTNPQLAGVQLLDGDGRFILGRKGSGMAAWLSNTPEVREQIKAALRSYNQDTVSNPVPGISNALRFLRDKDAPEMRMGIYILGDEFNSRDPAGAVLERIDALNPRAADGRRPITISAVGFPTTIRYQFSMGNTGLRFANLMRVLTYEHGGSFIGLPDL
jgi:beta-lactamase regulating signal transducer with metallopeptidase domain